MSEDYYNDGFNNGYDQEYKNIGHEKPQSDCDRYSYDRGRENGERRKEISEELDREYFGDDY